MKDWLKRWKGVIMIVIIVHLLMFFTNKRTHLSIEEDGMTYTVSQGCNISYYDAVNDGDGWKYYDKEARAWRYIPDEDPGDGW
jgi:hypothetical protein